MAGDEENSSYAYKTEYDFEGGPSIASLMYSTNGFKDLGLDLAVGIQINYIFGSLYFFNFCS